MFVRALFAASLILAVLVTLPAGAQNGDDNNTSDAVGVCRTYFEAMDNSDLDAAEKLFAEESLIFETGGVEGSWNNYREHHLGPEIDAILSFKTSLGEPETMSSKDGTMSVVAWPIEYHIELKDDREIDSRGTVTFILLAEDGAPRIRHLHWSSRRVKQD